jgi:hypothetical protein
MTKRLTESERIEMMRRYVAGVPTAQIARDFGVSDSYPSQIAAKMHVKRRVEHEPRDPEDRLAKRRDVARARALAEREDIAKPVKPAPMNVNSVAEIRRLFGLGRKRTEIAALLRCPYRVVDAALA